MKRVGRTLKVTRSTIQLYLTRHDRRAYTVLEQRLFDQGVRWWLAAPILE